MRILVAGDTHGELDAVRYKARYAKALGADRIIVVGDFGLWPGYKGMQFIDGLNAIAHEYEIYIFALPGNHEDHDQWDRLLALGNPTSAGFTYIRDRILLSPKVHNWKWGYSRFYICGGAVSIDKQWRKPGVSWWPNETFSEEDLASVEKYNGPAIDFLFTHDCSDFTKWEDRLKPDADSQANRRRIDRAIKALRPRYQFHGHMHTKYEWLNTRSHGQRVTAFGYDDSEWNGAATKTYGLECNYDDNSWLILDIEDISKREAQERKPKVTIAWPGEAWGRWAPDYFVS